ncbi:MAG: hypothetical protein AVDCRST_MAG72-2431 [uncultured Nocardioidaceae bacterium]|uniref:DUF4126 domain-containing protein n=1 Tax=uncultured Nocardioidaceae bacterium TaxID=253824 RepID=A0A6J4MLE5_9ACTN|nr:MAG: hypothetical protein AVDCRST_MAG72-2431 [uncultured Nocardioidaceae bacterium]
MGTVVRSAARSAALGFASGCRSSLGVLGPPLASRSSRAVGSVAMAGLIGGELAVDKLPSTPSRMQPVALLFRYASGAAGSLMLARRERSSPVIAVAASTVGASLGAVTGSAWRDYAGQRGWQRRAAFAEDAVALALTALASRSRSG